MQTERRKNVRLLPTDRAFAVLGKKNRKIGKIIDISKGGLSFGVVVDDDSKPDETVEILLMDNGFHLSNVPCTVIYNKPADNDKNNSGFISSFITRQYGLQFGKLTADQEEQLEYFLENHVSGAAK